MSHLYVRQTDHAPIHWGPEQITLGKQAVESVTESVDSYPVEVDGETAEAIREEYQRLVEETSGGTA